MESRQSQEKTRGNNHDESQRENRGMKAITYEESLRDYQEGYEVVENRRERDDFHHNRYDQRYSYHERNYPPYPVNYYPIQQPIY